MSQDKLDARTLYAQSSDIRARTYLEYRRDMKKKAIAELEVREWIENKLREIYPGKTVKVEKAGGDKYIWFLRRGGITREPDFVAEIDGERMYIEFQYAEKEDLKFYDFKVTKVVFKKEGKVEPIPGKLFFYLHKPLRSYAFLEPGWIMREGELGRVEAWRTEAFRVPKDKFEKELKPDPTLDELCQIIDAKIFLLNFQHKLLNIFKDRLSDLLQKVVDEEKIVKIIPKDMESFFRVCFILDNLNRSPLNKSLWLIYILSYVKEGNLLQDISKIIYCIDFLYSKIEKLSPNELTQLVPKLKDILRMVKGYYSPNLGFYLSSPNLSPIDETRYAVFSINLLEDLIQDIVVNYEAQDLHPIKKIYEEIEDPKGLYERLLAVESSRGG